MEYTRNPRCSPTTDTDLGELLRECTITCDDFNPLVTFENFVPLGNGTYGEVVKVMMSEPDPLTGEIVSIPIAVKIEEGIKNYGVALNTVRFSRDMGEAGIGPEIYFTFYTDNDGHGPYTQYLGMEYFDQTASDILFYEADNRIIREVVAQMISLIYRQIGEYGLYCTDIKPDNFVVRIDDGSQPTVRMIDFGFPHCNMGIPQEMGVTPRTIFEMIILMLYFMVLDALKARGMPRHTILEILDPFYDHFTITAEELQEAMSRTSGSTVMRNFSHYHPAIGYMVTLPTRDDIEGEILEPISPPLAPAPPQRRASVATPPTYKLLPGESPYPRYKRRRMDTPPTYKLLSDESPYSLFGRMRSRRRHRFTPSAGSITYLL